MGHGASLHGFNVDNGGFYFGITLLLCIKYFEAQQELNPSKIRRYLRQIRVSKTCVPFLKLHNKMRNFLVPPQRNRAELLDLGRGSEAEVRRSLHDIRRINFYLGGARVTVEGALELLKERDLKCASVLDVGSGIADIPARLISVGARRGLQITAVALDNNRRHLHLARQDRVARGQSAAKVLLCGGDAFRLPFGDQSVDLVVSTLFLHHFRAPQIGVLLDEFARVSRVGFVMNDLVRNRVPLAFFRLSGPIFARSYLTRLDGAASIRRAYTVEEMTRIVRENGPNGAIVRAHFPYRLSVTWQRAASSDGL